MDTPNQHGAFPYLWVTSTGTNNKWDMYDAYSNSYICSIANVSASGTQYRDGYGGICYVNIPDLDTSQQDPTTTCKSGTQLKPYGGNQHTEQPMTRHFYNGSKTEPSSTSNTYWMWRPYLNTHIRWTKWLLSEQDSIEDLYTPSYTKLSCQPNLLPSDE